jgi:phosphoglucosamine mutase
MRDTEQPLFELGNALKLYPQVLLNVLVDKPLDLEASANIQAAIASVQTRLNGGGRVLLRASGTEPKVRVMVEGQSSDEVKQYAQDIAQVVEAEAHLG